jgi:hypothetical protein
MKQDRDKLITITIMLNLENTLQTQETAQKGENQPLIPWQYVHVMMPKVFHFLMTTS